MALALLIDGTDRTENVEANSLQINAVLTRKRDTAAFSILAHAGDTYVPRLGLEVIINDGATRIFGGVITGIDSTPTAFGSIRHKVFLQDFTRLLDKKLVPDSFESQTVDQIMASLQTSYFPAGFTINSVDAPVLVKYVGFQYKPLAKCIEDLADLINYDWYVDYYKDVHFFAKESVDAPISITDDNGNAIYKSLIIRRDNSQMRNSIIVRGGEYLGTQFTSDIQTNGVDFIFPLGYRYSDFAAHLTGHVLSIGVDYLNDPNSYDALYNFQEKILRFKQADTPSSGKTLKVSGKPYLPVIVKLKSPQDIRATSSAEGTLTADSEYQYLIEDKSINSKEGARQRAQAEILAYAETLSEGEFITFTSGLEVGQRILINSATRGINEYFIINRIVISQFSTNELQYKVSLITTRTFDLIDVLQRLLLESTKKIEIDPNEIVDVVESMDEEITLTEAFASSLVHNPFSETTTFDETFTAQSLNYDVEFVWGDQSPPSSKKRVFILDQSPLH